MALCTLLVTPHSLYALVLTVSLPFRFARSHKRSIAWNFNSSDPEWGTIQAKQLQIDAQEALRDVDMDLDIVLKKGFLEILPRGFNKVRAN